MIIRDLDQSAARWAVVIVGEFAPRRNGVPMSVWRAALPPPMQAKTAIAPTKHPSRCVSASSTANIRAVDLTVPRAAFRPVKPAPMMAKSQVKSAHQAAGSADGLVAQGGAPVVLRDEVPTHRRAMVRRCGRIDLESRQDKSLYSIGAMMVQSPTPIFRYCRMALHRGHGSSSPRDLLQRVSEPFEPVDRHKSSHG